MKIKKLMSCFLNFIEMQIPDPCNLDILNRSVKIPLEHCTMFIIFTVKDICFLFKNGAPNNYKLLAFLQVRNVNFTKPASADLVT